MAVTKRLPLPTLLSQSLVAFTIEFDNEFEHQTPHRTTNHGSTAGSRHVPWLVSMVMWSRFMRFIPSAGISVGELQRLTGASDKVMQTWLTRMGRWWGYIAVQSNAASRQLRKVPHDAIVVPTAGGQKALEIWRPLTGLIESRWRERFGEDAINYLRRSLGTIVGQMDSNLPDSLPILKYGLFIHGEDSSERTSAVASRPAISEQTLPALLSKVLLAFAVDFERDSTVSLAICANVLRLLGREEVRLRDLPRLAAVSTEAVAMSLTFLEKHGYVIADSSSRVKMLVLTPKGMQGKETYLQRVEEIEGRWQTRFGEDSIHELRVALERLVCDPASQVSPLFRGLEPYPDGWRASLPGPAELPHFPMMLHRGGFPDGS